MMQKLGATMRRAVMGVAVGAVVLVTGSAVALTSNRVDAKRDWSVFEAEGESGKICWVVTQPKSSAAFRDGKSVEVRRGDIFLMVAVRPADGVTNEVSFIAGYPFQEGTTVEAKVGERAFTMFTDGENAWPRSEQEDDDVVVAFRRGIDAEVRGVSSRGTTTVDTFSLLGFTDALESARSRCGS
ncbi:MAG: invasion associated locus B family protein [Pseudomonadota bacterium]